MLAAEVSIGFLGAEGDGVEKTVNRVKNLKKSYRDEQIGYSGRNNTI